MWSASNISSISSAASLLPAIIIGTDPKTDIAVLKIDPVKVISTVKHHGNTSAASIPLALDYAINNNKVRNGHLIGFQAIGGGLSWGASVVRYGKP